MNAKEKIVLQKVQDYFLTVQEIGRLYSTLLEYGEFEGSITSKITPDGGARTNTFSSKVESSAIKKTDLEYKINELSREIHIIDEAINYINEDEKQIIDFIIQGNKLSEIARKIKSHREKVKKLRNSAIKKMAQHINCEF